MFQCCEFFFFSQESKKPRIIQTKCCILIPLTLKHLIPNLTCMRLCQYARTFQTFFCWYQWSKKLLYIQLEAVSTCGMIRDYICPHHFSVSEMISFTYSRINSSKVCNAMESPTSEKKTPFSSQCWCVPEELFRIFVQFQCRATALLRRFPQLNNQTVKPLAT